jgi:hypothetical protein
MAILVSMYLHFGHSNVRRSEWSGRGVMLVSFVDVRHLPQRGRSTGESKTSVRDKGILPPRDLPAAEFPARPEKSNPR